LEWENKMSEDAFAYKGYRDRVTVEKIPHQSNYKRQEVVSGRPEDVMLYVADRLNEPTTVMYSHMAWCIATIVHESGKSQKWPTLKVVLTKSNYAGD